MDGPGSLEKRLALMRLVAKYEPSLSPGKPCNGLSVAYYAPHMVVVILSVGLCLCVVCVRLYGFVVIVCVIVLFY